MTTDGEPVWLELLTTDVERSLAFYTGLFGWKASAVDGATRLRTGRTPVADLRSADDDLWLTHLRGLPGSLPAVLTDPSGARVGRWAPGGLPEFGDRGEPGTPTWFELHTEDFAEALPFYVEEFGWRPHPLGDSDEFRMVVDDEPSLARAGIYDAARDDLADESMWMPYFAVADADAAASRIRELGGSLLDEPADTPFGRLAHAVDPLGTMFTFIRTPERT